MFTERAPCWYSSWRSPGLSICFSKFAQGNITALTTRSSRKCIVVVGTGDNIFSSNVQVWSLGCASRQQQRLLAAHERERRTKERLPDLLSAAACRPHACRRTKHGKKGQECADRLPARQARDANCLPRLLAGAINSHALDDKHHRG